jgi:hypothetical protein
VEPAPPRLAARPLPAYAYRPGRNPHPRRHRGGHSYGAPPPRVEPFAPEAWRAAEPWLHAIDLFHAGYFWESHEGFEALAAAFGKASAEGRLLRALVQLAAAELKRATGGPAAGRLAARARRGLAGLPEVVLGVRVRELAGQIERAIGRGGGAPPIRLPLDRPDARGPARREEGP